MVDQETCNDRHDGIRWRFRGLFWLIGIATVVVGSPGWAGFSAKHALEVHEAVQKKTEEHRDATLARIESMVEEMHAWRAREPP